MFCVAEATALGRSSHADFICRAGDCRSACRLLAQAPGSLHTEDEHGWTALHVCAQLGDNQMITCLLDAGADASRRTPRGRCALLIASSFRPPHRQVIRSLLERHGHNLEQRLDAPEGFCSRIDSSKLSSQPLALQCWMDALCVRTSRAALAVLRVEAVELILCLKQRADARLQWQDRAALAVAALARRDRVQCSRTSDVNHDVVDGTDAAAAAVFLRSRFGIPTGAPSEGAGPAV